ncbi:uncharacterized protein METZ01_LOCUS157299 [marine metagenome]|uniref:Dockerin domain-containing protein n=1 Tax=marine metagenome TaxID=408172 RepID=A0A382ASC8_9ZZZZ
MLLSLSFGVDDFNLIKSEEPFPLSEGKIVFHSYSDYEAWDGKLFLYDFSEQLLTEISQGWDIDHTINAHFSPDGSKIVFMGAPAGNHNSSSWDIYLWDLFSDLPINLTANNGLRDEDPKFSPNGSEIVFKQNGDLKVMDLINDTIIHTTNNGYSIEESMPYFTSDNQYIIYARGAGISSDIYLINKDGMENQPLENITNIQEYYPIIRSNSTFLYTRWVSAENHHDQIYLGYFSDTNAQYLFFNDEFADDSDPFPVNSEYVLFSSNRSGGQGGWDLYLADINSSTTWSMDEFNLNSSIHELGICYYNDVSINGCTDSEACNYDEIATADDGSCEFEVDCAGVCGGDLEIDCGGVCGGDNSTADNCCGIPFNDDCTSDCYEDPYTGECCPIWEVDECGVCGGDNTSCQQLGDINGDGYLDVLDVVLMVNMILEDEYDEIADINEDGVLNVLDVVILVNLILDGDDDTCIDIDGNFYESVQIGEQLWMAENLKVTHFNNGDEIPTGYSASEWDTIHDDAYAVYDDDPANAEIYGNLYNYYAVDDSRGICPENYHIPTDDEWYVLLEYLGGDSGENWIIAGGKMKDVGTIEDGDGRWYAPNEGANNESGFTAIPAGFRLNDGQYYESGYYGIFWSSTAEYYTNAFFMWYLLHDDSRLYRGLFDSQTGLSVRCLKD